MQNRFLKFTVLILQACITLFASAQKKSVNVSVLLPFCAKQIIETPGHGYEKLGDITREYYQGLLLALDSFERENIELTLKTFDTENDSLVTLKHLQNPWVRNSELIIGPVMQGGNKMMSAFAAEKKIYHVSPLMTFTKTRIDDPYLIQANPDIAYYGKFVYDFIAAKDSVNCLLISDKTALDKTVTPVIKSQTEKGVLSKIQIIDYTPETDLIKYLKQGVVNHIIIPSSSEATVNGILRKIKDTTDGFRIQCYGFPQWLEFKNTDYVVYERLRVHIPSTFYVNYNDADVKQFIINYRERYYAEPSESAFKGYDQAMCLIRELSNSGSSMIAVLKNKKVHGLHTNFEFRNVLGMQSAQNAYLNMLTIEAFKFKKVN